MLHRLQQPSPPAAQRKIRALRRLFGRPAAFPYFLIGSVLIPLALFGFAAYRDWRNAEAEAQTRVGYVRDALAEHALRVFKTSELVALAVQDRLRGQAWDDIARSEELQGLLKRLATDVPEVLSIWLVDGSGVLRASSGAFPAIAEDLSGRSWFKGMRDGTDSAAVAPAARGSSPPENSFSLVFRREAEAQAFDGLIRIAVSPESFRQFYRSIAQDGSIALIRRDGAILARYPDDPSPPEALPPASPLLARIVESDRGVFAGASAIDGGQRIYGYARIGQWPAYVGYGIGEEDVVRRWFERLTAYGLYFIPAALALLVLAYYAWRSHEDLEMTVDLRTRALSGALGEREQLLKEVHHRVKNNMQIVSSLIRLQNRVGTSSEETIRRIQAMTLVHDLIYTQGQFASVDLAAYASRLAETLKNAHGDGLVFQLDLKPVAIALDRAMPFALILSEVVTNAIRHAFKERLGTIAIGLSETGGTVKLRIHDDGFGFNPEVDGRGFGLKLVQSLAVQLDATFSFEHDAGTTFAMTFPVKGPEAA
jgi:two-component system, sensor histidine kinase PdtaS